MKKENLSKYIKITVVLLNNILPICYLVSIGSAKNTDFAALGFLIGLIYLIVFNLWALLMYYLTKQIQKPVVRDVLFYIFVLLFMYAPLILWLPEKISDLLLKQTDYDVY